MGIRYILEYPNLPVPQILSKLRKAGQVILKLLFSSTIQGFYTGHQSSFASKHTKSHNTMTSSLFWKHNGEFAQKCIGGVGNRVIIDM